MENSRARDEDPQLTGYFIQCKQEPVPTLWIVAVVLGSVSFVILSIVLCVDGFRRSGRKSSQKQPISQNPDTRNIKWSFIPEQGQSRQQLKQSIFHL
jgi:hypothetical protein